MKVMIYFGGSFFAHSSQFVNIYLNGELVGWSNWYGKIKLKHVPEGENTVEIEGWWRKKIRFTASQNVKIWAREYDGNGIQTLIRGEDVKILGMEAIHIIDRSQFLDMENMDGKPQAGEKKEPKESAWESFKNKYI